MPTATTRRKRGTGPKALPAVVESVSGEVVDQSPAQETEARVKEALREGKSALWKLAEALYDFDQQQGWESLGYENVTRWLEDPEIDMTRGTYYRLVGTWEKLHVGRGIERARLERVNMSKAALVADEIAQGSVPPDAALKDVQEMSAQQLREKYEKPKRGRPARGQEPRQHSQATALRAASELPWDLLAQAAKGRSAELNQARLKEAIPLFLAWRDEFLA